MNLRLCLLVAALAIPFALAAQEVTCGSVVKLQSTTGHVLHSPGGVNYPSGARHSGQQSVTGYPQQDSAESLWVVTVAQCQQGSSIPSGAAIRLQHVASRRWLHSHLFQSPLSGNQEVSAFGGDGESDTGDLWEVSWDAAAGQRWLADMAVRLRHVDTGAYLGNHAVQYSRPIPGHTEVHASKKRHSWKATQGVYAEPRQAGSE